MITIYDGLGRDLLGKAKFILESIEVIDSSRSKDYDLMI